MQLGISQKLPNLPHQTRRDATGAAQATAQTGFHGDEASQL
jgi:hypothetical protein